MIIYIQSFKTIVRNEWIYYTSLSKPIHLLNSVLSAADLAHSMQNIRFSIDNNTKKLKIGNSLLNWKVKNLLSFVNTSETAKSMILKGETIDIRTCENPTQIFHATMWHAMTLPSITCTPLSDIGACVSSECTRTVGNAINEVRGYFREQLIARCDTVDAISSDNTIHLNRYRYRVFLR